MSDVFFPIVGGGLSRMATVRCDCLDPKDYPAGRALVLARDEQEIERILADARATEATGAEIARPIWVRFTPQQFSGRSYGLALALADKLARYRPKQKPEENRFFATGIIEEDGFGKIGGVQAFEGKLAVIAEEARPGDIVVLPAANLERVSPAEQALLDRLDRHGVVRHTAESLNQLVDLYGSASGVDGLVAQHQTHAQPGLTSVDVGVSGEVGIQAEAEGGSEAPAQLAMKADHTPPRGQRRLALMAVALLVTGVAAFVAGDWSRDRSLVASYANEPQPADDATSVNLLENPSFEAGEGQHPAGWTTYSRGKHDHADRVRPGGIDGDLVLEQSSDKAFYVDTHQVLEVESGFYALSAWIDSNGGRKANRMRAQGDEPVEVDIPITPRGEFQRLGIDCIGVTKGRLAVGFYMDAYKDSMVSYDKVEVVENPTSADGRACIDIAASGESAANPATRENLVTNSSFEQGQDQEPIGWETFSRGKHDDADRVQASGMHGSLALEHGSDDAFYVDTYQIIPVPNGYYSLSAWIKSDREKKANRMYARAGDADLFEADIPATGNDDYRQLRIHCVHATEGRLVVGFYTDSYQAGLTAYDDVQLQRNDQTADGRACSEN
ncbi:MAG: hypothetical protein ACR2RA_12550 [Geminicoccaceae bacterium]